MALWVALEPDLDSCLTATCADTHMDMYMHMGRCMFTCWRMCTYRGAERSIYMHMCMCMHTRRCRQLHS